MHLAQEEFENITLPVEHLLDTIFGGMCQSACIEDCIGKARDIQRDSKNTKVANHKPFHQAY
eukprot:1383007-Amphidinium_carterae.1